MTTTGHPAGAGNLSAERRELLVRWLRDEGRLRASDVAGRLGVSLDTVRRDLQELADAGALRRVHGGALPLAPPGPERFVERFAEDVPAKASIAAAAGCLLRSGDLIAMSGGTTTLELAHRLPADLEAVVLTTSPDVALALAEHPSVAVDLVGGRLERSSRTVTGPEAVDALRRVRPDVCVLSACSLHPATGVTLRDRDEALVVRAMLGSAGRVLGVLTGSKLGTAGRYPVAPADRLDVLVTDADDDRLTPYRDLGIEVVRA